jgi:hypothetical protein
MPRLSYHAKKKAARIAWSRNANAAKARKRMERKAVEPEPKLCRALLPFEITIKCLVDGESGTFRPRSGRHAKRVIDLVLAHYVPSLRGRTSPGA